MDALIDINWSLVKRRINSRVMTTLRQMVLEETGKRIRGNPDVENSIRISLKNEGIIDDFKINKILSDIEVIIADEILKQKGTEFLALIPKLVAAETQKIAEEMADALKEVGVEAGNELVAELSSTT